MVSAFLQDPFKAIGIICRLFPFLERALFLHLCIAEYIPLSHSHSDGYLLCINAVKVASLLHLRYNHSYEELLAAIP